jgi:abortive infection bacteriophage resistance protein
MIGPLALRLGPIFLSGGRMEYLKPWLPVHDQIERLVSRGVEIDDKQKTAALLHEIGYYRLTGYLYPFRESEDRLDETGRTHVQVLNRYRPGTRIMDAAHLLDFDRRLRMLVLEGVERLEVAIRTQIGHTLGRHHAFAHEEPSMFVSAFIAPTTDANGAVTASQHGQWLSRIKSRQDSSDEAFVAHFRAKYDDRMPIWALTEILELGHLSRLYTGLRNDVATEVAHSFCVPTKRLMASWLATLNYVRNIAAHHARLFNRKLVTAPKRPRPAEVPLLAHLSESEAPKQFGVYSALAVMAYILRSTHIDEEWPGRVRSLLRAFPSTEHIDLGSMGVGRGWLEQELWSGLGKL